jgi:hypothetical protein
MPRTRHVLIAAAAGLSISMLPLQFAPSPFGGGIAWAKNGDNNGGGKGGGGGGGRGADKDRSGNNGKGGGKSSAGRSASKGGSGGGLIKSLLRGNSGKSGGPKASTRTASVKSGKSKKTAALPEVAEIPAARPEKNLNARLGSLNSLKRNVNAYLNSNSPRMALIREYVLGSAQAELAADALLAAQEKFDDAVADLALVAPFDGSAPLVDPDLATLEARLAVLDAELAAEALDPATLTDEELAALETERAALLPAVQAARELGAAEDVAVATPAPDAAALEDALIAAGNPNFQSDPIDPDVLEWATDVLDGKIAEVKDILAAEAAADEPVAPEPELVEPVETVLVPVEPVP